MAGIFSLRNWVMKQLMKTDKSGIMKIPPKGKVDFGEMLLREQLFTKGIGHTKFKKVEWLFGKEIEIPEEWEIKNLDILCSQIVDGPHVSPKYVEDGIPFLTVNNVMDGFINLENVKY